MLSCENPDKSLLLNKEDISEYEMTRYNIVTAISCTDTQKKVLKDNHVLKVKNAALNALSEIRGNLELPHSSGTLTIPMKEGRLEGDLDMQIFFWGFELSEVEGDFNSHKRYLSVPPQTVGDSYRPSDTCIDSSSRRRRWNEGNSIWL